MACAGQCQMEVRQEILMTHLNEELLNEYLDGVLDAQTKKLADAHLANCGVCRAQLDDLRHVFVLLSTLADEPVKADLSISLPTAVIGGWAPLSPRAVTLLALEGGLAVLLAALAWPRLLLVAGDVEARLFLDWSGWLVRLAAVWEVSPWLTQLGRYADVVGGAWQASATAISGRTWVWAAVSAGALAAWLAGNRLLLKNGHELATRGGDHE